MIPNNGLLARVALVSATALALAACGSSGSYRVASVGSAPAPDDSSSGGGGSGGGSTGATGGSGSGATGSGSGSGQTGSGLLVTAGNAVIGTAGVIPESGVVSGTVDRVLTGTGQTLVRLGSGQNVLLNGTGGAIGEAVSLDLGQGKVVGGSAPLVGLNVLATNPSTGQLATVGAGTSGNLVSVAVPQSGVASTVSTVGNTVNGATGGAVTAGATGNAAIGGNTVGTTVNGVVNGATVNNLGATVNAVTQPATATVNAALGTPK